ncbi:MAG: LuxR C-terminal-related transcriptional regulator [Caldilineaceae bacterium]
MLPALIPFVPRTKLRPPRLPHDILLRTRLLERLNRPAALTLIVAPAGYGKTTLAGSWVAHCNRPSAWVSLDDEDSTLAVFVQRLVMAVRSVFPAFGDEILSLVASPVGLAPEMVLPGLLNELDQLDRDFVLVLDDYHHIADSSIHQLLWGLLAHPPRPLHLVLTARHDPPIPPRIRAHGAVTELRACDLGFTTAETHEFLRQSVEQPLDAQAVAALVEQSEGWAACLRLAALFLQQRPDITSVQDLLRGSRHFLLSYLDAEVTGYLSADVQLFLARTSLLSQLNGSLCDAVIGDSLSHIDSRATLRMLEQAGIFITALDLERDWFQYHGLFRTLLQHKLHMTHEPAEIAVLNQRAGAWYAQHRRGEDARQHVLTFRDQAAAVDLVAHPPPLLPARHEIQQCDQGRSLFARAVELAVSSPPQQPLQVPACPKRNIRNVLTFREMDVLLLLNQRLTNKEIARTLGIARDTVRQHTVNIYRKLGVQNRRQAIVEANGMGFQPELSRCPPGATSTLP